MPEQAGSWIYDADASPLLEANRRIIASLLKIEESTIKTINVLSNLEETEKGLWATTNRVTAVLEDGAKATIKYKQAKDEVIAVSQLQVTQTEKETAALEANTEAQRQNALEVQKRQAAEAMRRGELALQTVILHKLKVD